MSEYLLRREQTVPRDIDEVWAFFADPGNLEAITPGFLRFRILTPQPIPFDEGALIDYRLRLFGVPIRWKTRIEEVVPRERFVDRQLSGPYKLWHHTHEFEPVAGGTLVRDTVRYRLPVGPIGRLTHAIFVKRALDRIFDFRREKVAEIFGEAGELVAG